LRLDAGIEYRFLFLSSIKKPVPSAINLKNKMNSNQSEAIEMKLPLKGIYEKEGYDLVTKE
jgi:hypothetical protein